MAEDKKRVERAAGILGPPSIARQYGRDKASLGERLVESAKQARAMVADGTVHDAVDEFVIKAQRRQIEELEAEVARLNGELAKRVSALIVSPAGEVRLKRERRIAGALGAVPVTDESEVSRLRAKTDDIMRRGRPKKGEARETPWVVEGISRAAWYARQKRERSDG